MVDHERPFKITKCNEDDRDWSSMPADIIGYISSRLTLLDYYSFVKVCTSWRLAKQLSTQFPFVFLHQKCFLDKPKPFVKLLNLTDNLSNNVYMPMLDGKVCIGSQHGWLILVDNTIGVISLYNPFSQEVIKLPSHAPPITSPFEKFSLRKVVMRHAPIPSTVPLPAAAAILYNSPTFLYKRDGQSSWKSLMRPPYFLDVTWWRGMFVGVMRTGSVYKLDLDVPEPKFENMAMAGIKSYDHWTVLKYNKFLVNLDDSLLQVWCSIDSQGVQTRSTRSPTISVKVMQLDLQLRTWIPVHDLCGYSLFLGTSHSFSMSSQHTPGLKDNLIYFVHNLWGYDWHPHFGRTNWKRDIGVFDLRTGTYEICVLPDTPLITYMFDDVCGHSTTSAFWYAPPPADLQKTSHFKAILSCTEAVRN